MITRGATRSDLTGRRYGRLTVLRRAYTADGHCAGWVCRCDCGTVKEVAVRGLRDCQVTSCGCSRYGDTTTRARPGLFTEAELRLLRLSDRAEGGGQRRRG